MNFLCFFFYITFWYTHSVTKWKKWCFITKFTPFSFFLYIHIFQKGIYTDKYILKYIIVYIKTHIAHNITRKEKKTILRLGFHNVWRAIQKYINRSKIRQRKFDMLLYSTRIYMPIHEWRILVI